MSSSSGKITLILGPMFAGKTTELQRRLRREIHAQRSCCVVKYCKDNRYSHDAISTHDKNLVKATFAVSKLSELEGKIERFEVVAIDEGQFFPDLNDFCETRADAGQTIFISALDGDFQRRPFGRVCELIPLCEEVVKLTAICMNCHEADASFTCRTIQNDQQELIGGAEMYAAVCRKCYNSAVPPTPGRISRYKQAVKEVARVACVAYPDDDHTANVDNSPKSDGSSPGAAARIEPQAATPVGKKRPREE